MGLNSPFRIFESRRLTPAAWILTRTSSSLSFGPGISPARTRSERPYRSTMNAFMSFCLVAGRFDLDRQPHLLAQTPVEHFRRREPTKHLLFFGREFFEIFFC